MSPEYRPDEIARAWLVKMHGEDAPGLQAEFEAWLAASPEHRLSYDRAAQTLQQSAILKSSSRYGSARAGARSPLGHRRWLPAAGVAITALLLAALGVNVLMPASSRDSLIAARAAEPLITRRGEIRTFRLAGGATATLDTDSRLEFVDANNARHLRLARGLARFDFGDGAVPFRVEVGGSVISGDRAELDIGIADGSVIIMRVLSGSARMGSRAASSADGTILPQTKPLRVRELPPPDWPTGWSEHRSISLAALAREANRYAARPIIIDDGATGQLEVSGRFRISRPASLVNRLAKLFDLSVEKRADGIHLRRQ
ncbi:FecR family protein [Sphingopyxis sp.]|jgi:transmembrane sensor|uniref:FecR family protein n=1 Tax=Sphingopyxis sp. TaxID=1908224 RepID=UPI002DFCCD3D|nr:DUF4880 domain-containing protein [Sphingopyxis sp.]